MHQPGHERVIADLERGIGRAERRVDDRPGPPAGRGPEDHLLPQVRDRYPGMPAEPVSGLADEHHRLGEQRVQDNAPQGPGARGQGNVHRGVAHRLDQAGGSGLGLAQLDDHAGVMLADLGEDRGEVQPAGMQGAAEHHRAADLAAGLRDLVLGRLNGRHDPPGGQLQRLTLLGQRDGAAGAVEQRRLHILLQAGDGARHGGRHDMDPPGRLREAPGIATGEEILQVTDFHATDATLPGPAETVNLLHCRRQEQSSGMTARPFRASSPAGNLPGGGR